MRVDVLEALVRELGVLEDPTAEVSLRSLRSYLSKTGVLLDDSSITSGHASLKFERVVPSIQHLDTPRDLLVIPNTLGVCDKSGSVYATDILRCLAALFTGAVPPEHPYPHGRHRLAFGAAIRGLHEYIDIDEGKVKKEHNYDTLKTYADGSTLVYDFDDELTPYKHISNSAIVGQAEDIETAIAEADHRQSVKP